MKIKLRQLAKNRQGDTLIEVIIATVIIGMVLLSAYTLSGKSFQLGRSARERSQATQLVQEQAEGLRALRDAAGDWGSFRTQITGAGADYHLEREGDCQSPTPANCSWVAKANSSSTSGWDPSLLNPELPNFYRIFVSGQFSADQDHYKSTIRINWPRFGNGPDETSTLFYNLTDRQITITGT